MAIGDPFPWENKTSVSKRKLTPDLNVKVKTKKRPRGKSFEKGNGFGAATRFQKGVSGNPGGRTKSSEISKALRAKLQSEVSLPRAGRTYAEKLVDEWVEQGLQGNVAAISAIADRAEGRPNVTLDVNDSRADPLTEMIAAMNARSKVIGRPEGQIVISEQRALPPAEGDAEEQEAK